MAWRPTAGDVVAWWDGDRLEVAVVVAEEKRRFRLLQGDGKESRVAPGRIAFALEEGGESPGADEASLRRAAERASQALRRVDALASAADVALVWELASESGDEQDAAALAELAFGSPGEEVSDKILLLALLRAFQDDGVHFVRKGDTWRPRPREAVEQLIHEREAVARLETERTRAREALVAMGRGEPEMGEPPPVLRRYLQALEDVALHELDAEQSSKDLAEEALGLAGVRSERIWEGAFRLLRSSGRYRSDDENLAIHRYGLHTSFPPDVHAAAEEAGARGFERSGRRDLTSIPVVTVDSPSTLEVDDGLSAEILPGGAVRLGIHIADPAAFVHRDDRVDAAALERAVTHFFPERKLHMLPPVLAAGAASLGAGEDRPALSFVVVIGSDGALQDREIHRSIVRVSERLDYDAVDAILTSGRGPCHDLLLAADGAARAREEFRLRSGAVVLLTPEVDVHVGSGGEIRLERIPARSRSRRLVSEAMVAAGALAAEFCRDRGVPAIYRRQAAPGPELTGESLLVDDPCKVRELRRSLKRGESGLQHGPHHALGLECYAQATSPLRRYQDLANHRQIIAALEGRAPEYDEDALRRIAATTERAELNGRRAERDVERYWLLRYLQTRADEPLDAIVLGVDPRPVVLLEETLLERPVPSLAGVSAGERVRLRVAHVNPRADILALRRI